MPGFFRDLRYAARTLGRSPGLVLVATLSLALGMGVNTTLFSAVKGVLFAEATASAPDRLVRVWIGGARSISYTNLHDIRETGILEDIAGYGLTMFSARSGKEAEKAVGEAVTGNYFDVLGVRAAIGRTFSRAEADPDREPRVVVLSDGYWRRHFDQDADAVGRTLSINGQPCTVIGILPGRFQSIEGFGLAPEIYVPLGRAVAEGLDKRDGFRLRVLGRMKNGRTRQQTQAALARAAAELERAYPAENRGFGRGGAQLFGVSAIERLREAGGVGPAMMVAGLLVAVSATVLLIACGNVAGLLAARGANRRREIAVRLALGASRGRIVQQLLAESLLLALLGAACGWLLNLWTPALLTTSNLSLPLPLPFEFRFEQGMGLLPLELVLSGAAMLLCGLAPAMESARVALIPTLKEAPGPSAKRPSKRRKRGVVWQVAGSMVQLVVAMLFLRTLGDVVRVNPGFDVDRILNAEITLDEARFNETRGLTYLDAAVRQVGALPGVETASVAAAVPLSGWSNEADVEVEGRRELRVPGAKLNSVSPEYFRTMGIALVRGRDFHRSDRAGAARVAIASETLVRRLFPDGDALGRHVRTDEGRILAIVGVVRDSTYGSLGESPQPLLYQPLAQEWARPGSVLHVRTAGPPAAMVAAVKRALAAIEKDVPISIRPMRDYLDLSLAPIRTGATILAIMGGLGMLLALVGLYGLISHNVARRTHDFGIRMTLGASPEAVLRGVLKEALILVGSGVAVGLLVAVALTQVLGKFLAGVKANDALSLLGPVALLLAAGLAASYLPARRATQVDPATALRCE